MGTSTSSQMKFDSYETPVKPELLISELAGEVSDEDYLARSVMMLRDHHIIAENLTNYRSEDSFAFEDSEILIEPGYLPLENGWVRRKDGSLFVSVLTDLGQDVNGDMFDWWFCHCDDTEKYRWWHPHDHIRATWDPSYYSSMPFERIRGHYVDHVHIVEEMIGGEKQALQIEYMRPSKVFDISKFAENNITACLVARIYLKDATLGMIGAGHMVHIVRENNGRSELRSRIWLGDDISYPETPENYYFAQLIQSISSSSLFRTMKVPYGMGKALHTHCAQEMACLKVFLPHYYHSRTQELQDFQRMIFQQPTM